MAKLLSMVEIKEANKEYFCPWAKFSAKEELDGCVINKKLINIKLNVPKGFHLLV